ncbi:ion transporter [Ancylothrix sp. C2]|uniref:ion transporter n=1 Tax=Ancylothrix sp. D3o TaxID=2953691 RepID=UPI0021BA8250|nr:ion transporter [Ancylothrix sp. D3o]MCT7949481.1 ion transporter [Ancylothrix sp. D3o]
MYEAFKHRVYEILEVSNSDDWLRRLDDYSVTILVILDVADFILKTLPAIYNTYQFSLLRIEKVALIYFTILYILQIWSCTADVRYAHPIKGRLKYAVTPLVLIDLMAILPFYLMAVFPQVALIESLEVFRLLRLLKLIRYSESLQTILRVLGNKKQELFMTFLEVLILLVFASSLMYFAENKAQPEAFPSIPAAMWWGVVTLTTVGYGDIYPITAIGKFFGAMLAFIGIGLFALPAGIIASGFSEEVQRKKQPENHKLSAEIEEIGEYIDRSAEVMKLCIEAAKNKFGEDFEDEEKVFDLASLLYEDAVKKFNL